MITVACHSNIFQRNADFEFNVIQQFQEILITNITNSNVVKFILMEKFFSNKMKVIEGQKDDWIIIFSFIQTFNWQHS